MIAVAALAFSWVTLSILRTLGVSPAGLKLISYIAAVSLLVLGLETIWRAPPADVGPSHRLSRRACNVLPLDC